MAKRLIPHYRYAGVYMIKHERTGKVYIGSSIDIEKRLSIHNSLLIRGVHPNKEMQNDFNLNGKMTSHVLYVEPVEKYNNEEAMRRTFGMEQKYIEEYNAIETGYNQAPVGKMYRGMICSRVKTSEYIPNNEENPQE